MKIYKVYSEKNAECRQNEKEEFESIIMEQNGNEGKFFTDFVEAKKAYDAIRISRTADKRSAAVTFYTFDGKLIEDGEIDEKAYEEMVEDGEELRDIFLACDSWGTVKIETSEEYAEE